MRLSFYRPSWLGFCMLLLAGCAEAGSAALQVTSERLLTPTAPPTVAVSAPVATPEITPEGPLVLNVWLPESVAPTGNDQARFLLADQIDAFHAVQSDVRIETRLKKPQDVGGIMETLKAASVVAPNALPDLTLLRRSDLLVAAQTGLISPLEGSIPSALLGDLYPVALSLGQVNGTLYGIPYTLDVQHMVYRPEIISGTFATFGDVLANQQPFIFPAAATDGVGDVLLLQYLSAGGTLIDLQNNKLDADALRSVLEFYQQAVEQGVVNASVLTYAKSEDYVGGLVDNSVTAAVVSSSQYLDLSARGLSLQSAPIPLATEAPSSIANGWMWVMVTRNPEHQELAVRFLNWMFDAGRQSAYTRAINMLPSERGAMRLWEDNAYREFAVGLLNNARLPLPKDLGSNVLRVMQTAFAAVVGGQRTADEAVADAIEQLDD